MLELLRLRSSFFLCFAPTPAGRRRATTAGRSPRAEGGAKRGIFIPPNQPPPPIDRQPTTAVLVELYELYRTIRRRMRSHVLSAVSSLSLSLSRRRVAGRRRRRSQAQRQWTEDRPTRRSSRRRPQGQQEKQKRRGGNGRLSCGITIGS